MKRSSLFSTLVLLIILMSLLAGQTIAQENRPAQGPAAGEPPCPEVSAQVAPPARGLSQQGGWQYGPPSTFQYQRFDGAFVPGLPWEPWANKVYFLGGRTSPSTELPDIWSFDPRTGSYADTQTDVIEDVSNYNTNLIMDDGTDRGPAIYVIGGYDRDNAAANIGLVQRYYPQLNLIESLPPADNWPVQVAGYTVGGMGTAVVDDVIYVFGGWESTAPPYFYNGTWVFDPRQPSGSRWTDLGLTINPGRSYIQTAVQDDKIYCIGGISGYDGSDLVPTDAVEVLDTANLGAGWTAVASLPIATAEGRAFGFDDDTKGLNQPPAGRIYLTGGGDWPATSTEVLEYFVFTDTWNVGFPDLNDPRVNHAGTYIPLYSAHPDDGLPGMWVFGGRSYNGCYPPYAATEYYSFPTPADACSILLVDDDWDQYSGEPFNGSGTSYYTSTLDTIGLFYDRWDVWTQGDPALADLQGYDVVVWFTGYAWDETITSSNEADLAAYLDGGGNLLISAEDYIYDQGLTSFGRNYLGIADFLEDTAEVDLIGNAGDPIGDGLGPYTITVPTSWPSGTLDLYTDRIFPAAGVGAPFRYEASGESNSTDRDSGIWRTVFWGWPFEGLAGLDDRVEVMSRALDWFCFNPRPPEVILLPPSQTGSAARGTEVTYTLTLINNIGFTETFTLTHGAAWPIAGPAAIGPVGNNRAQDFVVTATVPADTNCGDMDTALITATSVLMPSDYADSALIYTFSDPPGAGTLSGTAYDTNTNLGIPDAHVSIWVGDLYEETWTDVYGTYSFTDVAACTYEGATAAIGYYSEAFTVVVDAALTTTLDVYLDAGIPDLSDQTVNITVTVDTLDTYAMTLTNQGTGDLRFHVAKVPAETIYPVPTRTVQMPTGVDPQIWEDIAASADGETPFLVYMTDQADLSAAFDIEDWAERGRYVYDALKATVERSQSRIRTYLDSRGVSYRPILSANALAVTAGRDTIQDLAAMPGVAYLRANHKHYTQPESSAAFDQALFAAPAQAMNPTWGMTLTQADRVWSELGITGTGIVVANIDTGVHWTHEALQPAYRGWNGITATHDYNWWDPSQICPDPNVPCDNDSHGSATMGLMVGWNRNPDVGDPAWNAFGMAPGATWMSCKGCEYAWCSEFALLSCADFMLAPWDLTGANPDPGLRPHVVNNSWGGGPAQWWYNQAVYAWRAAGIFPAFAAGNSGELGCGSAESPGNYAISFATCATDINDQTAWYSSLGPAQVTGILKPNVCAPGPGTCTAFNDDELYGCGFGGTSAASPHSAGLAALLWSAVPDLIGDVQFTSWLIEQSAFGITSTLGCGDDTPADIPNNEYGWGRIDAYEAVNLALSGTWDIPWLEIDPLDGIVAPSESVTIVLSFNATGLMTDTCYTGTLKLEYNDPYTGETFLPVEMCVQAVPCEPPESFEFTWSPTTPTIGLATYFTATVFGAPTEPLTFTWDFGDGSGPVVTPPPLAMHVYTATGTFTVTLRVENPCYDEVVVHVLTVEEAPPPRYDIYLPLATKGY